MAEDADDTIAYPTRLARPARSRRAPKTPIALSGCRPLRMTEAEVADYDGRYEYWDAESEIAWQVRDVSRQHEEPRTRLVEVVKDIAKVRGKPIAMFGSTDLQERDARGTRLVAAEADEIIYLDRPDEFPDNVVVGRLRLPDVVFEVDLTTDVRERKLALYASWGVPELWVEVPEAPMPSKRKAPGLTIHVLREGRFQLSAESAAFPTWTAREIHAALNEPGSSETTVSTLRRVGEIMARRSGTGPDDDPFLGAVRRSSRLAGWREGTAEGKAEGSLEERLSILEDLLISRDIRVGRLRDIADRIVGLPRREVVRHALACLDYDDFLRRLPRAD